MLALCASFSLANAQLAQGGFTTDGLYIKKYVEVDPANPNAYNLNLETFVSGDVTSQTIVDPIDVLLVLDNSSSLYSTFNPYAADSKYHKMRYAVNDFLKKMQGYQTAGSDVKVGIVIFSTEARTYAMTDGFIEPNSTKVNEIIGQFADDHYSVDNLSGDGTYISKAMDIASQMVDNHDKSKKCAVIVFTDGQPTVKNAMVQVKDCLTYSKQIKDSGAKVYSIGLFSDGDQKKGLNINGSECKIWKKNSTSSSASQEKMTMLKFLSHLSSEYPKALLTKAGSGSDQGGDFYYYDVNTEFNDPHDTSFQYYQRADDSDLSKIFEMIAKEIGKSSLPLTAKTTTLVDVITDSFMIPEVPEGHELSENISLLVAKCKDVTKVDDKNVYSFEEPFAIQQETDPDFPGVKVTVPDRQTVKVTGFDYSKHFVAKVNNVPQGYKLIVRIPIVINPACPGGANVETNTSGSGIYYDPTEQGKLDNQMGGFEIPSVKIPNIVIVKYGLKEGESAIFNVYKYDSDGISTTRLPISLVATQGDGDYAIAKAKIQTPGRYLVEETAWSWAYTITECQKEYSRDDTNKTTEQWNEKGYGGEGYAYPIPSTVGTDVTANSITRNLNDFTEEVSDTYKCTGTFFIFRNTAKDGTPAHDEASKDNKFIKIN